MTAKKKPSQQSKVDKKTTLIIQLDESLKKDFQALCKAQDMNCSQTLRKFMKSAVDSYKRNNLNVFKNQ
jgi:hypothetical protein